MNSENNIEIMGGSILEEVLYYKWYIFYQTIFILYNTCINTKLCETGKLFMSPIFGILISISIIIPVVSILYKLNDTGSSNYIGGNHSTYIPRKRKKRIWIMIIIIALSYPVSIWIMLNNMM